MTQLVTLVLIFLVVGLVFLMVGLMVGAFLRPSRPNPDKATIYECGEPTIGSAWVQFDLRFYVVALLFVIFDVEMAFFFPWGVVFGTANRLQHADLSAAERQVRVAELTGQPSGPDGMLSEAMLSDQQAAAGQLAWLAFTDILIFFGILILGFAYIWRRGDLDWVKSLAGQVAVGSAKSPPTA